MQAAGRLWAFRARVELEAAARFEDLGARLRALDAAPEVCGLAARASEDERRHHAMCVELARYFGVEPSSFAPAPPMPVGLGRKDPRERLLAEVVAMSCVTESLSTALLIEMRREATVARVREVAHEVLRDEVDHARLGWAHLASEVSRGVDVGWLGPRLPDMLAATVHEELFGPPEPDPGAALQLEGRGGLRRRTRCDVFVATMEGVVFRGLERVGVRTDAGRHWLRRAVSAQRGRTEVVGELDERLGQR